jgi:hypothetical protein
MTYESQTLTVRIERPFDTAYEYVSDPANWTQWAAGLGSGFTQSADGTWTVAAPDGNVTVKFTGRNEFGVADHWVTTPDGQVVYLPFRVVASDTGTEALFTLYQQPGMTDDEFARDAGLVRKDLDKLKEVLEGRDAAD